MAFSNTGLVGANTDRRTVTREFKLGTPLIGDDGETYLYVQASAAIAANTVSVVTKPAMTAAGGAGAYTTGAAFASGEYGWIRKTATPL